jgi:hypothetical protein
MARRNEKRQSSDPSQDEAVRIARGTQRPGQTKEQTRLIAQGIRKGIEQYKKQQSAKARELDRKLKKLKRQPAPPGATELEVREKRVYKQRWLPWVLLVVSWVALAACWLG